MRVRMKVPHANMPPSAFLCPSMRLKELRCPLFGQWKRKTITIDQNGKIIVRCIVRWFEKISLWFVDHFYDLISDGGSDAGG